jgi:ATP-dependent helicase/nuclease subunit B
VPTRVLTTAYGASALDLIVNVVSQVKNDDPMTMTTIVIPNHLAGMVVQRHLSTQGGIAGLQVTTLPRLAERIAATNLAPRRPQTRAILTASWRASLDTSPGGFAKVSEHPATTRALALAHRELRDLKQPGLDRVAAHNDLSADVIRLHRQVVNDLSDRWYDETDLLHEARRQVEKGQVSGLGQIVLYLPQAFTNAETGFTQALADQAPLTVLAGLSGYDDADRAIHRTLDRLGLTGQQDLQRPLATKVLHASDADDEVRCVVRRVVTTLQQTPAHRVAILYAVPVPYARLLHEHLAAAGLVVNGPGVRSVGTCQPV